MKKSTNLILSLLLLAFITQLGHAQTRHIALVTTVESVPLIKSISECFALESILIHNRVEENFRRHLKDKDDIELEVYHHVNLVSLYKILQREDIDAVFLFGHMGALDGKTVSSNHTNLKDLKPAFKGLKGQSKFIGLCGCYSFHLLNNIKEIAPEVVAYGFQTQVTSRRLTYLTDLFDIWYTQAITPEREINKALSVSESTDIEKIQINLTFTRACDDPDIEYYDELLILDQKKNCLGYFPETEPCVNPQIISAVLEIPTPRANQALSARWFNFTCTSGYRALKTVNKHKPVFGKLNIESDNLYVKGHWDMSPGATYIRFNYKP